MIVAKNPAIASLDPESLCHGIYSELYSQFFNAQDRKGAEHPYGIEEGDGISIRLHNMAYGFAYAIAGAVEGGGTGGNGSGILLDYLRKDGGDMSGLLRANCGIEAGTGNKTLLASYDSDDSAGIRFDGDIDVRGHMCFSGNKVLEYEQGTLSFSTGRVDFGSSAIRTTGELIVGDSLAGVSITRSGVSINGNAVYHKGTANLGSVDWTMKDADVAGELKIAGAVTTSGYLKALHGAELGNNGMGMLYLNEEGIDVRADLSFASGYGIRIAGRPVLTRVNDADVVLSNAGGDLLLGNGSTGRIRLLANLTDADGDYTLLTKYGAACFPDSLIVKHNYGDDLLSTYRADRDDEGITIHKRLRFGTSLGPCLYPSANGIAFSSFVEYAVPGQGTKLTNNHSFLVSFKPSTSRYAAQGVYSESLSFSTDADFVAGNKPFETKGHIGIDDSPTRMTDGCLFLSESAYLIAGADGIRHFGNATFMGGVSSGLFSSGFAGSGWAILKNQTTGNVAATFDELTVRKKMRIYELEIQKTSAANGSLWVSDSCSGDSVVKL